LRVREYTPEGGEGGSTGDGPPAIVILHGLFGSGDNWHAIARELSRHYRVLLPDLPNHGDSPHSVDMSYVVMAGALNETMTAHGVERACLVGHSMGGKVAMTLALTRPERVSALVVVDIAPRSYPAYHKDIIETMRSVPVKTLAARSKADVYLAEGIPDRGVRAFLMKNLVKAEDGEGYAWRLNLPVIAEQYESISSWPSPEGRYDGPALFVAGGRSPYMKGADSGELAPLFPGARIERISDAGHWVHAEAREEFLDILSDFLREELSP